METDESELERSRLEALEPDLEKFEIETEGGAAGTTPATSAGALVADAFGWSGAATTPGTGTAGVFTSIEGPEAASCVRMAEATGGTTASDNFSSKRRPA